MKWLNVVILSLVHEILWQGMLFSAWMEKNTSVNMHNILLKSDVLKIKFKSK